MIKSQKYLKSIAKGVLVLMMVISLGWGAMAVPVSAADVSISQLIELFISLGIIAPEKAAAARSAAGVSSPAVTLITPNTIQDIDFQVMKQPSQTVKVSRCQNISKPGNYILTGNIKNDSGKPCITISDVKNVTFDCKGKTIQSTAENFAILVKNSSDFIVQNCSVLSSVNVTSINPAQHMFRLENSSKGNVNNNTIGGTYSTISSSTEIEFKSNTVSATTFQIFQSNFVNIISNKFSAAIVNTGAVVQFKEGINNKFIGNSVDGKSDGIRHGNSAPPNIGPDDVVVLDNQNSINVSNNNIRNSWECGIESVGFLNDSTIANNKIDNVALAGICGWHWLNFSENTISNNTITNSPSLFVYFRDYDLRPGESQMKFINNYFDSNKLITQRMDGLREQGYSSSIRVYAPPGKGGGFEFSNFTDEQVVTGNNVFKNNDFGLFLKAPILFPASMFVDGGGNICSSSSEINYPIKCETDKFLKPVINNVQSSGNSNNIIHPGQKATVYGTNLSGVNTVYIVGFGKDKGNFSQITRRGSAGSDLDFTVPTLTDGNYSINVQTPAGQSNSVTVQVKNPTPIVISTSAIITSVQTAGEYPNIIHPGQKATVYGSNLKNTGTVHILGRATEVSGLVLGGSAYDNNVFFTVPLNLPDGDYIIDVQDINGVRSNTLYNVKVVNVTLTTPVTMSVNPSITVLSPNGGESIVYENLYMAGDLGFSWKSSDGVNYAPTSNLKVSLVNANGVVVREEFKRYYQTTNLGNGVYHASFTGQNNITPNNRYKIKICDLLTNSVTDVCDVSDNYFTITDSVSTQSSITVGSNNTASALIGFDQVVKLIQALMK